MTDLRDIFPNSEHPVKREWNAPDPNRFQRLLGLDNSVNTPVGERVYEETFFFDDRNRDGDFDKDTDYVLDYYGSTLPEGVSTADYDKVVNVHYDENNNTFGKTIYDGGRSWHLDDDENQAMLNYLDRRY
jgi:hypothetical protein